VGHVSVAKKATLLYTDILILKLIFYHSSSAALEKLFMRPASKHCLAGFDYRNRPRETKLFV